jgi:hypothetical protein
VPHRSQQKRAPLLGPAMPAMEGAAAGGCRARSSPRPHRSWRQLAARRSTSPRWPWRPPPTGSLTRERAEASGHGLAGSRPCGRLTRPCKGGARRPSCPRALANLPSLAALDAWLHRSGFNRERQAVEEKRGGNSDAGICLLMDLVVEIETVYAERGKRGDYCLLAGHGLLRGKRNK